MSKSERPLPAALDSEKFILGSILLDGSKFAEVNGALKQEHFALEKNRRIWARMSDMAERGEVIDRVTVANELQRFGELESVDGLSYLVSLDDGLPQISNINSYVAIVVEKYRLRRAINVGNQIVAQAFAGEENADTICLNGQARLADDVGTGFGSSQIETARSFVETYPGGVNSLLNPELYDRGIPTGFIELDDWTSGLHASEIFLIGARPGTGKTAWVSCVAKNVALQNRAVAFFSLELNKQMALTRIFCEHAYLSYSRFRRGQFDEDDRRRLRAAVSQVMDMPLFIDDTMGLRVADIRVKLNRIMRERPVELLVIDYAQLIKAPKNQRFATENDRITSVCEDLKALCKDTRIPLLLLSQLNRDSEKDRGDNRPKLSQARGGGAFEEVCYVGGCLYREYARKPDREDLREQCDLIIDKNRSGRTGTIKLKWTPWAMRFSNPDA